MSNKLFLVVALVAALAVVGTEARAGLKGRFPVMGWNTWCTQNSCGVDWCTSDEVLNVARYIKESGMQALGYDHINLDDCWGVRDNKTKQIKGDPQRFPEGMKAFIQKIHDMGFKFGLYTDIGEKACHSPFTGSYPYYQEDANTFASWNVDYVKFDGCDVPSGHTPEELTCNFSQALNNTGREMWLTFHCWHTETCAKCGDSYRIGPDHHDNWKSTAGIIDLLANKRMPFWGPDPEFGWPDPDFVFTGGEGCGDHSPPGVRCPGQTNDEYVSEFTIWALAGGHLLIASDPRNMTQFQKYVWFNKEVISIYNDTASFQDVAVIGNGTLGGAATDKCSVSLVQQISHSKCEEGKSFGCYDNNKTMWTDNGCRGFFKCDGVDNVECNVDGDGRHNCPCVPAPPPPSYVFARPLSDGTAAIALFNGQNATATMGFQFRDIPKRSWGDNTPLKIRNVWQQKDTGTAVGHFSVQVPAHGTILIRLSEGSGSQA